MGVIEESHNDWRMNLVDVRIVFFKFEARLRAIDRSSLLLGGKNTFSTMYRLCNFVAFLFAHFSVAHGHISPAAQCLSACAGSESCHWRRLLSSLLCLLPRNDGVVTSKPVSIPKSHHWSWSLIGYRPSHLEWEYTLNVCEFKEVHIRLLWIPVGQKWLKWY